MRRSLIPIAVLCLVAALTAGAAPRAARKPRPAAKAAAPQPIIPAREGHWVYPPGNSPVVADVDGRPITVAMVEQKYLQLLPQDQPPADSTGARLILNLMVQKALVAWLLDDSGYRMTRTEDSAYRDYSARDLRNLLYADIVEQQGKLTRDEVRAAWETQKTNYCAHMIQVGSKDVADSLVTALRGGGDFTRAALELSRDPSTRALGGMINYALTRYLMPRGFESVLIHMKPGQISDPALLGGDYYIFRLDSLQTKDPGPFENMEQYLYGKLSQARQDSARQVAFDRFAAKGKCVFNDATIALVATRYDSVLSTVPKIDTLTGAANVDLTGKMPRFSASERELHLLESAYGPLTIGKLMDEIKGLDPALRPKLSNQPAVRRYAQTMALQPAMDAEVRETKFDQRTYVKRDLRDRYEFILASRFYKTEVEDKVHVPEDSVRAYYKANLPLYVVPEQVRIRKIEVDDSARADSLLKLLKETRADFADFAKQYSADPSAHDNGGLTDFFAMGAHDTAFDREIFTLRLGETYPRPLKLGSTWYLVSMAVRTPARQLDYKEGSPYARKYLESEWQERRFQALLGKARARHPVRMDAAALAKVKLSHVPPYSEL